MPGDGRGLQIIGIAGASGSGKSYLAQRVAAALGAPVLSIDSYYRDLAHLPPEERGRQNFDHPDSLDWPLFLQQLTELATHRTIAVPEYDFCTHTREGVTHPLSAGKFAVVEGILTLHHPAARSLLALAVFVELDAAKCLERRMERDIQDRGRTRESVLEQYHHTVFPMFQEFVAPSRAFADLRVQGDAPISASTQRVLDALRKRTAYSAL